MIFCLCRSEWEANLSGRLTADYQNGYSSTASSAYVWRRISQSTELYYTDQIHYTNSGYAQPATATCLWNPQTEPDVQAQLLNMYTFGGMIFAK
jgi:hypothetical protein